MNRKFSAVLVALCLSVSMPSAAAPLSETLTGEAKADFDAAKVLFEDGDFSGASAKFQQAYDRSKDVRILWNVAVCEKAQRHYVRVRALVERYVADGKDSLSAEQTQAAQSVLETIKPFIGTAKIVTEEGVEITVDGERVGTTPFPKPLALDLGRHQLSAQKAGYKPFASNIVIEGGTESTVEVVLERMEAKARVSVIASEGDTITFDGRVVAVTRWQSEVDAGTHGLRVFAPKHKTYEIRLDLPDGANRTIEVTLENEAKPLWPWIAGGVAVAGALTIGGYFLFKPDAKPGEQTPGSLAPGSVNLASVLR